MTSYTSSRREFLGRAVASGTGLALGMGSLSRAADHPAGKRARLSTPNAEKRGWRVCCQIYTFRDRTFYEALEVLAGLGVRRVEPAFFLPLSKEQPELKTCEALPQDKRREMKLRMSDLGITMPNYYAPLEGDKGAYRKIFDFAKEMGVETLVAEPPPEMFEALDGLCQEYKIQRGDAQPSGRLRLQVLEPGYVDEGVRGPQRANRSLSGHRSLGQVGAGHAGQPQELPEANHHTAFEGRR